MISLPELLKKISEKLPIVHDHYETPMVFPCAVWTEETDDDKLADNINYIYVPRFSLELYTKKKDIVLQRQLKELFKANGLVLRLTSPTQYLRDENMYVTVFSFSITEG